MFRSSRRPASRRSWSKNRSTVAGLHMIAKWTAMESIVQIVKEILTFVLMVAVRGPGGSIDLDLCFGDEDYLSVSFPILIVIYVMIIAAVDDVKPVVHGFLVFVIVSVAVLIVFLLGEIV